MKRVQLIVCYLGLVLHLSIGQICQFELPPCDGSILGLDIADYEIRTSNSNPVPDQQVCFSSNTSQYTVSNTSVRIHPSNSIMGSFCTNVPLNVSEACSRNNTPSYSNRTVMHFNIWPFANTSGSVQVNFTRNGEVRTTFDIVYRPDGIYTTTTTPLNVNPGSSLDIEWTVYSASQVVTYQYNDSNGVSNSSGQFTNNIVSNCVAPESDSRVSPSRPSTSSVHFSSLNIEDTGIYSLSNSQSSSLIQVNVRDPMQAPVLFSSNMTILFATVGNPIVIVCDIQWSSKSPNWYYKNTPITTEAAYTISNQQLTIANAQLSLSGEYTCTASNEYGNSERQFLLVVGIAPNVTVSPMDIVVHNNSRLVLPCTTTGLPPPMILWYTTDSPMTPLVSGSNKAMIDPISGALSYGPISSGFPSSTNVKTVFCTASIANAFMSPVSTSSNALVNVTSFVGNGFVSSPLNHTIGSTRISSTDPFITLHNNESVELSCYDSMSADLSSLNISWFKDNTQIPNINTVNYTVSSDETGSTWGYYCCRIQDLNVILDEKCVSITVRVKPQIIQDITNASVQEGSSIGYYCLATTSNGIDLPVVSWYKDGILLDISSPRINYFKKEQGLTILLIQNITRSDAGTYTCNCSNFVDTVSTSATVNVIGLCTNNSLSSSSAEDSNVINNWSGSNLQSAVTVINGEKHFMLESTSSQLDPYLSQAINLTKNTNYTIYFSGRMRTSNSLLVKPIINLTAPGLTNDNLLGLPFPNLNSWQWVSTTVTVLTDSSSTELLVSMQVETTNTSSLGRVYFDDLCISVMSQELLVQSTPTMSTMSTMSPTSPDDYSFLVIIIASVGTAVLILLALFILLCCCCCSRIRSKRRGKQIDSAVKVAYTKNSKGVELVGLNEANSTILSSSMEHQPVYVTPGETPLYLDTTKRNEKLTKGTKSESALPQQPYLTLREDKTDKAYTLSTSGYDYPRTLSATMLVNGKTDHSKIPEDTYDDPNKPPEDMYDNPNSKPPEDMYDDPNKPPEDMYDDPNKPPEDMYDDPNKPPEDMYDDPNRPPEDMYDDPNKPPQNPNKPPEVILINDDSCLDDYELPLFDASKRFRTYTGSSSITSMPLPPLPNTAQLATSAPVEFGDYMSLNPASVNKHVYASTSSLAKESEEQEIESEYLSITKQDQERIIRLSQERLNSEDDYI